MIFPGPDPQNNPRMRLVPGKHDAPPIISNPDLAAAPGCGLASYGALLIAFCLLGIIAGGGGMIGLTIGMLQGSDRGPSPLRAGVATPVYLMGPLRATRLVALTEVPLAFHDESDDMDGTLACAMMADRLIFVQGEAGVVLPYANLAAVTAEGEEHRGMKVTAQGTNAAGAPLSITCGFRAGEGGSRMLAQLESERLSAQSTPRPTEVSP